MWLRTLSLSLLSFLCVCVSSCRNDIPVIIIEEKETIEEFWLNNLCSCRFNGRKAGTVGCEQASQFIIDQLDSLGYDVIEQPFSLKGTLNLRNFYVRIQGESDSLVVVGAHYDGAVEGEQFQAADDNGSGVVTLLSICDFFSKQSNRDNLHYSVLFAFWAAEESTMGAAFNGSRYFVNNFEEIKNVCYYCNLDCFARKDQDLLFYYSAFSSSIMNTVANIFQRFTEYNFDILTDDKKKLNSDHASFNSKGIPFIGWNDINTSAYVHTIEDNIGHISFEKIRAVKEMTVSIIQALQL